MGIDRPIDITADQRKTLLALLKRHLPNTTAWAYGSRVKWTSRPQSDLDLVVFTKPEQERRVSELREAFEESNLPFRVDLLVWRTLPEQYRKQIEAEHVVLVEKEEQVVAGEWRRRLLGELTENFDAVRVPIKQADRQPGPYPYYGASGIVDSIEDYLFDGEYLLIAEDGENLRTRNTPIAFLANGKFWVNNHAHIVQGNHEANTRYLMYALSELDISGYLTGSTMPKLTQANMNQIPLLTPPPSEQRAIAHVLGTLDDKIELNRRMNETLEAMVRALFKSWFIDFDPVRAKMAGRDPYLAPELWDLFPDALDDEDKPVGWNKKAMGELCEVAIGGLWGKDQSESTDREEYYCLRGVDLQHLRQLGEAPNVPLRFAKSAAIEKRSVSSSDVLIAASGAGPCGRPLWVGIEDFYNSCKNSRRTIYSNFVKRLHCKSPSVACFLDRHLNEMRESGEIQKYISGTSVPNLNDKGLLQAHQILLPSESLLDVFLEVALFVQRHLFSGENSTLAQTRDLLLPKLMSGEIRAAS